MSENVDAIDSVKAKSGNKWANYKEMMAAQKKLNRHDIQVFGGAHNAAAIGHLFGGSQPLFNYNTTTGGSNF